MLEEWTGTVSGLSITGGVSGLKAQYALEFTDGRQIPLNERIGAGLEIVYDGLVECRYCGVTGRRSYGGGYCYDCFTRLARCDLCVVSPDRCHFHLGTCREPDWGQSFCMQPHSVYLANSSGIKVGITRQGREIDRWLDQGAIQGLRILEADTRRDAGLAEVRIAALIPDRTDWRKMLRSDVPSLDLHSELSLLVERELTLPPGVRWAVARQVTELAYPLPAVEMPPEPIRLEPGQTVSGNLIGMKGQYLVLSSGALNVRRQAGARITLGIGPAMDAPPGVTEQLGLF